MTQIYKEANTGVYYRTMMSKYCCYLQQGGNRYNLHCSEEELQGNVA